ncbi:helix-turn-helix domain-containing protein [Actinomadura vinacea]|uniref:Helix-turn-helix domain-containing protein n=1 Tax=Actinomadura vinacea TaxID=115336 RepID=A0ABN3JK35_9ACTN
MGDFFGALKSRVDANARRAVELYASELAEYRAAAATWHGRAELLDFALILRRRTAELSAESRPFHDDDLEYIASMGRERGESGVSLASQRRVLVLHSNLTLREVQEAAAPNGIDDVMYMLGWLAPQGTAAQHAFTVGFMEGQKRFLPLTARVQMLADMLLAGDPAAPELARSLGMRAHDRYVVAVVRLASDRLRSAREPREEILEILLKTHRSPMSWHRPEEFVALVPDEGGEPEADQVGALSLVRDLAELTGRPCAVGTAAGAVGELAETVALARNVSRVAPVETVPRRAHSVADVFAELGAAQVPHVDEWLRDLANRLSRGPALVPTLHAYYSCDMKRLLTAATLHVHPRTLDYRLRRVRDLTGIDPGSTQGVRVLSTAVTRVLADTWPDS